MKIAIITHFWVANFGANLQALSTFYFLKKMGHQPVMLNYRPTELERHYIKSIPTEQFEMHIKYCKSFFKQTPILRNDNEITDYCSSEDFDVIIAGSDSILRIKKSVKTEEGRFPNPFWLIWANSLPKPKPRLAFLAASTEGSYYPLLSKNIRSQINRALHKIDYVSVRDRWSKEMIRWVTHDDIEPILCPDPVSVFNDVFVIPKKYSAEAVSLRKKYVILTSSIKHFSKSWIKKFRALLKRKDLLLFTLPNPEHVIPFDVDYVLKLPMHPLTWYAWIQNAAGVISTRFHPIVCSIFNQVPFVSIDTSGPMYFKCLAIRRASKVYDLCMNINATSRAYLPLQTRLFLKPENVMNFLMNWNTELVDDYIKNSKVKFSQTVKEIIHP